jgi:hypothetical protein
MRLYLEGIPGDDPDIADRPLRFMGVAGFKQRIMRRLHWLGRLLPWLNGMR